MLTDHARFQMARRHVTEADIATVLTVPEQREEIKPGRCVYQSRFHLGDPPKTYLVRVFVDVDRIPAEVVTVYRTSKVSKYWR
ncbi:MAG: DUF4258 domain-containing protein [Ardenticatenaceae bacterium]|nr:DUF4258 domain-containing protein [Ardenticatenaceae bacterium]HBY96526.1 hypothetical protein [Chloroflexota bacterium]